MKERDEGGGGGTKVGQTHAHRAQSSASSPERRRHPLRRGELPSANCSLQCVLKQILLRDGEAGAGAAPAAVVAADCVGGDDIAGDRGQGRGQKP